MQTYNCDESFVAQNKSLACSFTEIVCIQLNCKLLFSKSIISNKNIICIYNNKLLKFEELSEVEYPISVAYCAVIGFLILFENGKLAVICDYKYKKNANKIQKINFKATHLLACQNSFILVNCDKLLYVRIASLAEQLLIKYRKNVDEYYYHDDTCILIINGCLDASLSECKVEHANYIQIKDIKIKDAKIIHANYHILIVIMKDGSVIIYPFRGCWSWIDMIASYTKLLELACMLNNILSIYSNDGTIYCELSNGKYLIFGNDNRGYVI